MGAEASVFSHDARAEQGAANRTSVAELLADEARARAAFERIWLSCASSSGKVTRMRVCEALMLATRSSDSSPPWSTEVRRDLAKAFGGSWLPVGFEEAFQITRQVFSDLECKGFTATTSASTPEPIPREDESNSCVRENVERHTCGSSPVDKTPFVGRAKQALAQPSGSSIRNGRTVGIRAAGCYAVPSRSLVRRCEPTRADLDSTHVGLLSEVVRLQAWHKQLASHAQALRLRVRQAKERHTRTARGQRRLQDMKSKAAELEQTLADRASQLGLDAAALRHTGSTSLKECIVERSRALEEQYHGWREEAFAARGRVQRKQAKLRLAGAYSAELARRWQAEQLSVGMYERAMENEDEVMVAELRTALVKGVGVEEDARAVELEGKYEERMAEEYTSAAKAECVASSFDTAFQSATQIKLEDELAESLNQLAKAEAKLFLCENEPELFDAADAEVKHNALVAKLKAVQQGIREDASLVQQKRREEAEARVKMSESQSKLAAVEEELQAFIGAKPMTAKEAAEKRLKVEEAKLAASEAQFKKLQTKLPEAPFAEDEASADAHAEAAASAAAARLHSRRLAAELSQVKVELQRLGGTPKPLLSRSEEELDNEATTLQAQLTKILIKEAVQRCRIKELLVRQSLDGTMLTPPLQTAPVQKNLSFNCADSSISTTDSNRWSTMSPPLVVSKHGDLIGRFGMRLSRGSGGGASACGGSSALGIASRGGVGGRVVGGAGLRGAGGSSRGSPNSTPWSYGGGPGTPLSPSDVNGGGIGIGVGDKGIPSGDQAVSSALRSSPRSSSRISIASDTSNPGRSSTPSNASLGRLAAKNPPQPGVYGNHISYLRRFGIEVATASSTPGARAVSGASSPNAREEYKCLPTSGVGSGPDVLSSCSLGSVPFKFPDRSSSPRNDARCSVLRAQFLGARGGTQDNDDGLAAGRGVINRKSVSVASSPTANTRCMDLVRPQVRPGAAATLRNSKVPVHGYLVDGSQSVFGSNDVGDAGDGECAQKRSGPVRTQVRRIEGATLRNSAGFFEGQRVGDSKHVFDGNGGAGVGDGGCFNTTNAAPSPSGETGSCLMKPGGAGTFRVGGGSVGVHRNGSARSKCIPPGSMCLSPAMSPVGDSRPIRSNSVMSSGITRRCFSPALPRQDNRVCAIAGEPSRSDGHVSGVGGGNPRNGGRGDLCVNRGRVSCSSGVRLIEGRRPQKGGLE